MNDLVQGQNTVWEYLYEASSSRDEAESFSFCQNYGSCTLMLIFEILFCQAFGAPTIVAHINGEPQMFFGSDRFLVMAHMFGKWIPWLIL